MADPVRHADIWLADLDKLRPVLIATRDPVAARIAYIVAVPVTTTDRGLASQLPLGPAEGLARNSVANFDSIRPVPQTALRRRIGRLGPTRYQEFCDALNTAMGC
ncbi:MAG: type II toxin-antitoxin system PemK/MazF family toxin [Acidimicrobiales bacterium]